MRGITIPKPADMSDNEWHYFKLIYRGRNWSPEIQQTKTVTFHDGWQCCADDDTRRSIGEDLPNG